MGADDRGARRRGAARQDRRVPRAPRRRRGARRSAARGLRLRARGRQAHARHAPLRRPARRRRRAARGRHRRDEDRRGQDARGHAAALPQCARGRRRPPRDGQRLPGPPRRRVDATGLRGARHDRRRDRGADGARGAQGRLRLRHHLRHELRVRLRLPARQPRHRARGDRPAAAHLRDRGRGRLDPRRRGAHAADHRGPARGVLGHVLHVREHRQGLQAGRGLRGRREAQDRGADRAGRGEDREGARHREPVRPGLEPDGQPPDPGAARPGALQQRRRVPRGRRRGQDRRRVHGPHHGRAPLVGGPAPGRRGQGGRQDRGRERDRRHGHDPELLPPLRRSSPA